MIQNIITELGQTFIPHTATESPDNRKNNFTINIQMPMKDEK